jgi:hypothetical protein
MRGSAKGAHCDSSYGLNIARVGGFMNRLEPLVRDVPRRARGDCEVSLFARGRAWSPPPQSRGAQPIAVSDQKGET